MTKDELIARLGRPDSAKMQANAEYLTYYMSSDAGARPEPYMIRLIDAKVESFGRFVPLLDTQGRGAGGATDLGLGAIMPYDMSMDVVTQLQQLKALEDRGVLTKEEAQRAKERLLAKAD
ncbi:MAG: SHOCT domain-containing protein [Verrucomicrobia bacterium]|nr:SHOCT domain-containing protein [Verrucomicrobiota bacterium]